jgi:hypothetical protein
MSRKWIHHGSAFALLLALSLAGCSSAPRIAGGPGDYLRKGMASARLRGGEFYMATGDVELYDYDLFGSLRPSGETVEVAVAIKADRDTGEVLTIAAARDAAAKLDPHVGFAAVCPGASAPVVAVVRVGWSWAWGWGGHWGDHWRFGRRFSR